MSSMSIELSPVSDGAMSIDDVEDSPLSYGGIKDVEDSPVSYGGIRDVDDSPLSYGGIEDVTDSPELKKAPGNGTYTGLAVCPDSNWIMDDRIVNVEGEASRIDFEDDNGTVRSFFMEIEPSRIGLSTSVLGEGSFGTVMVYSCYDASVSKTVPIRTCAVKILNNEPEENHVGTHEMTNRLSQGCPLVLTRFLEQRVCETGFCRRYYTLYIQVMELAKGDAARAAKKAWATDYKFNMFCLESLESLLVRDMCDTDIKLENIGFIKLCDGPGGEFRMIDVDAVQSCSVWEGGLGQDKDGAIATYPIIPYNHIICPSMYIIQTWYAFIVSMIMYRLRYLLYRAQTKSEQKMLGDQYRSMERYLYWADIEKSMKVVGDGFFSPMHPIIQHVFDVFYESTLPRGIDGFYHQVCKRLKQQFKSMDALYRGECGIHFNGNGFTKRNFTVQEKQKIDSSYRATKTILLEECAAYREVLSSNLFSTTQYTSELL